MSEKKPILIALVVVGLLIVGYLIYAFTGSEPDKPVVSQPVKIPDPIVQPKEVVEEVVAEPEQVKEIVAEKVEEEVPAFVLPRLDESDQLIRDGVVSLTRHEGINGWLSPDELIRKIVVIVDNIANGNIARSPAAALAPRASFSVTSISDKLFVMDSASYRRYNTVTSILVSLDSSRAVEFYVLLKPLFQEAYEELGYPDSKFDSAIFSAIGRLLETPVLTQPVRLVRPVVIYEFEDPKLESLSAAQKQLIRMGPDNTRAIQTKLGELARELRLVMEG